MTPDDLRSLADEATPPLVSDQYEDTPWHEYDKAYERLSALAPDLARLCAEYAGAFAQIEKLHHKDFDLAPQIAHRALAKLSELKSVT